MDGRLLSVRFFMVSFRTNAGRRKTRIVLFLYFWQSIYQSNFCSLWIGLARDQQPESIYKFIL